jgi:hypothetical protein
LGINLKSVYEVIKLMSSLLFYRADSHNALKFDRKLRVLAYHRICPVSNKSRVNDWCVPQDSFSEEMQLLAEGKYNMVPMSDG